MEVRPCELKTESLAGDDPLDACDTISSHPIKTYKVERLCPPCETKMRKADRQLKRARGVILELNTKVGRLEKNRRRTNKRIERDENREKAHVNETKEEEEWEDIDEGLESFSP